MPHRAADVEAGLRTECGGETRLHARRSFHLAPFLHPRLQTSGQRAVRLELRGERTALREMGRLVLPEAVAPLGRIVPKLLAIHMAYLIGFQASTASRGFRSWFNFSSSKAR